MSEVKRLPGRPGIPGLLAQRFDSLEEQDAALAALRPGRPWLALSPARGKCLIREHEAWTLAPEAGTPEATAAVLIRRGARYSGLDLVWAGEDAAPEELIPLLPAFALAQSAPRIVLETLGAARPLPTVPGESHRIATSVYCVDLEGDDELEKRLAKNHRRNVRKARKEGFVRIQQDEQAAVGAHARLCQSSLDRRSTRGESIVSDTPTASFAAFLASGHGRIFQVGRGDEVLSSNLVARVGDSAYYLSGGTSPDGMRFGSSHLLMFEILEELRAEGVRMLNLGYTDTDALARFKTGFGSERVGVERVFADVGPLVARSARRLLKWVRRRRSDSYSD